MGLRGAGYRDDRLNVAKTGLRGAGYRDDRLNVDKTRLRGAGYRGYGDERLSVGSCG